MNLFLIANPKGGSGKTTLATNLAGYFASQGNKVMLGDIDRQLSANQWLAARPANLPKIYSWGVDRNDIERPQKEITHVILDSQAGFHGKQLSGAFKIATHVIVPVQPSIFDMRATYDFLCNIQEEKAIRKGRLKVGIVGMRVDARTRSAFELESFLSGLDFDILTYLRDTQNYVQAASEGMTIFDLPPSRVEKDLEQWKPVIDWTVDDFSI